MKILTIMQIYAGTKKWGGFIAEINIKKEDILNPD